MNIVLLPSSRMPSEHPFTLSKTQKAIVMQSLELAIEQTGKESFAFSLISSEFLYGKLKLAA